MKVMHFPFENYFLSVDDEEILWIQDKPFVIKLATEEDIERFGKGYFSLDSRVTEDAPLNS